VVRLRRLLSDWMLVELEPEKKMTAGGIIVPDTLEEPVRVGRVLMTGPGRRYVDKFVPVPEGIVGQRVAFMIAASQTKQGKQLRTRLSLEDNEEIIRLGDVLLIVEEGVEVSK
jgi:co-chaperonin GroES (HSP10)